MTLISACCRISTQKPLSANRKRRGHFAGLDTFWDENLFALSSLHDEPTRKGSRLKPRIPRKIKGFSQALHRTRTGDPFLTMPRGTTHRKPKKLKWYKGERVFVTSLGWHVRGSVGKVRGSLSVRSQVPTNLSQPPQVRWNMVSDKSNKEKS